MVALCRALATLNKPEEVAEFLLDFLSPKENETVAKRLRIAELLVKGNNYGNIRNEVGVGYSTIARVSTWLGLSGKGLKLVLQRKKKEIILTEEEIYDPASWRNHKRRMNIYYWPELLLEELIRQADDNQKEKIKNILDSLKIKAKTFSSQRNKVIYENFSKSLTTNK